MTSVSAVVPTVGSSPLLGACLRALRDDCATAEIIVVHQGGRLDRDAVDESAARVLSLPTNRGFSGGSNAGIEVGSSELVALVNDDAVVQRGWFDTLAAALEADPALAAAQGVNRRRGETDDVDASPQVDGAGIAINRWGQAIQRGHGRPLVELGESREIWGVSATAALYRRAALDGVATSRGIFDELLESYYEDVDLALRLRAAGWRSRFERAASAGHLGSASGDRLGARREALLYGNRLLVMSELRRRRRSAAPEGRAAPGLVLVARDLLDLLQGRVSAAGLARGWRRARRLRRAFRGRRTLSVPTARPATSR